MRRRILAAILSLCMVLTMLPMTAFAEETVDVVSGSCGENAIWTLTDDGTLTISGSGVINNYGEQIGDMAPWYSSREDITRIVVEDGITSVGDCAFYRCANVTEIVLPEHMSKMGIRAFQECSQLTAISIPNGITYVPAKSFQGCSNLQEIIIPEDVTEIGSFAFEGCGSLKEIVIPSGVTKIRSGLFEDCNALKKIVIPESVTEIGIFAFVNCSALQEIVIPKGVTKIEQLTFYGCNSLQEVVIPEGVTEIGEGVFCGCSSLQEIVIPKSVTEIGKSVFSECSELQTVVLPFGMKVINSGLFSHCSRLQEIIIPSGVTEIGKSAFYNCSSLKEIIIPSGVTKIGESAFYSCSSLKEVIIPSGVTEIGGTAFSKCGLLNQILVPASVAAIGTNAFSSNTSFVGAKGSAIEAYARKNNCNFTEHSHKWDDGDKSNLSCANSKVPYTCTICGAVEKREMTVPHNKIVLAEEFDNLCIEAVSTEYYKCTECERYFIDELGSTEISREEIIAKVGHKLLEVKGVLATCESGGSIEHYKCENCGKLFRDMRGTEEITLADVNIEKLGHSIEKVEAVQATCESGGSIEHYKCENCGKLFRDVRGTEEITLADVNIEKRGHSVEKVEAVQATCDSEGSIAYNVCESCGKLFRDMGALEEITINDIAIGKLVHSMERIEGVEATCQSEGSIEHYKCENCGKLFRDADGLEEIMLDDVGVEKISHSIEKVEAEPASCEKGGYIEHYICKICGKLFLDAEGNQEATAEDIVIRMLGHSLWRVPAKAATCTGKGNIEYFYCDVCNKKFSDASGEKQIFQVTVNPLGHKYTAEITKATLTANGGIAKICVNCGHRIAVSTCYKISTIKLSKNTYKYTGKTQMPRVTVKDSRGKNISASNYTVSYSKKKPKNVGKYKVTVQFKGNMYSGKKVLYYTILPADVTMKSISSIADGQLTVKWGTKKGIDGYQIRYSTKSNMKGSKTKTVKKAKTKQYTIKKLAKGKKYYVQVRGYKKISGKNYYGAWSKKKSAKTLNMKLNYKSLFLEPGQTKMLKLIGAKKSVRWKSSNPAVASVNSSGMVTAVADGSAIITAVYGGKSYSCTVKVKTRTTFDKLYDYINEYGSVNSAGDRYVDYSYYLDGEVWRIGIVYERDKGQFKFACFDSDDIVTTMCIGRNGSATARCEFICSSYYGGAMASVDVNVSAYSINSVLNFNFQNYYGGTWEQYNKIANMELLLGMKFWDMYLKGRLGFGMSDLGFTSY